MFAVARRVRRPPKPGVSQRNRSMLFPSRQPLLVLSWTLALWQPATPRQLQGGPAMLTVLSAFFPDPLPGFRVGRVSA